MSGTVLKLFPFLLNERAYGRHPVRILPRLNVKTGAIEGWVVLNRGSSLKFVNIFSSLSYYKMSCETCTYRMHPNFRFPSLKFKDRWEKRRGGFYEEDEKYENW